MPRILQGSILAVLVLIAGLLFNIAYKLSVQPPPAVPLAAAEQVPEPAQAVPMAAVPAPVAAPAVVRTSAPAKAVARPAPAAQAETTPPPPPPPAPAPAATAGAGGFRLPGAPTPASDPDAIPRTGVGGVTAPDPGNSPYSVVYSPSSSVPPPPPPPPSRTVTVPAGTAFTVRLLDHIRSDKNRDGDTFAGSLDEALIVDGLVVANRGATVSGRVVEARDSGRMAGRAQMALEIDRIQTVSGDMQVASDTIIRTADSSVTKDVTKAGVMAGIGAAIGAIAGGRRGAGIGAAAGGTAGTIGVMATKGKPVEFEPESRLTFRLKAPVTVQADSSGAGVNRDYDRPGLRRRP